MFKAIIESQDLSRIDVEPHFIAKLEAETMGELTNHEQIKVCEESPILYAGYCITVRYTREE